jgi:hypothetical protein
LKESASFAAGGHDMKFSIKVKIVGQLSSGCLKNKPFKSTRFFTPSGVCLLKNFFALGHIESTITFIPLSIEECID